MTELEQDDRASLVWLAATFLWGWLCHVSSPYSATIVMAGVRALAITVSIGVVIVVAVGEVGE